MKLTQTVPHKGILYLNWQKVDGKENILNAAKEMQSYMQGDHYKTLI